MVSISVEVREPYPALEAVMMDIQSALGYVMRRRVFHEIRMRFSCVG